MRLNTKSSLNSISQRFDFFFFSFRNWIVNNNRVDVFAYFWLSYVSAEDLKWWNASDRRVYILLPEFTIKKTILE